jgi:SPP1 gp7 family putative phage head morphogenesis protein
MATSTPLRLGVVTPQDAIKAFDERQLLLPSFRWQDVWQHEHQRAFAVAGISRADVLAVFRDALEKKLATGGTLAEFKKEVQPTLVTDPTTGDTRITRFDAARLQLIYDVNTRQSFAAGKWQRYQKTKASHPFIWYRTMDDGHVRPQHQAWHNLVLPIDDPFWHTHWPPNGWRCRCNVTQLSQRGIDRLLAEGQKLHFTAPAQEWLPYINPHSGEVKAVPRGIDPGFGYNPGLGSQGRDVALCETVLQKAIRSDAYSGAVIAAQAATDVPALARRRAEVFARWLADQDAATQATGATFVVGALQPHVIRALATLGQPPKNAALLVSDIAATQSAALRALYEQLPVLLNQATAVLQLKDQPHRLILVIDVAQGSARPQRLYLEVTLNTTPLNTITAASLRLPVTLKTPANVQLVSGVWP